MKSLFFAAVVLLAGCCQAGSHGPAAAKPAPEAILLQLQEGNRRFAGGQPTHPHNSADRRKLAAVKSQGDYALATIVSCSDSRVPVELIFDAGIMDLFVVRVPGNICKEDEAGGVEYGVHHVFTPLVVVLGHSDCGAVTAALQDGHGLECNIVELLKPIRKVTGEARAKQPELKGKELLDYCIRENVYQEIANLFEGSVATRSAVREGKVAVVGAIYDLSTGKVEWLDRKRIEAILKAAK